MIFDFEPWQLDIDIDLTKQLYRSCKGDFVRNKAGNEICYPERIRRL